MDKKIILQELSSVTYELKRPGNAGIAVQPAEGSCAWRPSRLILVLAFLAIIAVTMNDSPRRAAEAPAAPVDQENLPLSRHNVESLADATMLQALAGRPGPGRAMERPAIYLRSAKTEALLLSTVALRVHP